VYTYFGGKEDLIRAVAEEGMRQNASRMVPVESTGSGAEALALSLDRFLACLGMEEAGDSIRTDVRLTAEALEEGAVRDVVMGGYANLIGLFEEVVSGQEGDLPEDLTPRSVARVVVALFQGLETQMALDPGIDLEGCARAAGALLRGRLAGSGSAAPHRSTT
jgi:AcrR family transcriptional regulator